MDSKKLTPEDELYIIIGKLFAHHCADKGIPFSPMFFKKHIKAIAEGLGVPEEKVSEAFVFLHEETINIGLEVDKKNRVQIGYKKTEV